MVALPETPTPTRDAIFDAYEADADTGFRPHLGASQIGKSCERALWYDFRWATPAQFPGRILRLFETGQLEEARLVKNLRRIGATVLEVDPETGRQWRVEAHGCHFGGSLDGVALGLPEAPKTWHVLEFKTHSLKSFRELVARGVAEAKPQHWAQMQIYMHLTGLTRAMYLAVCKDTDDLHVERVHADGDAAERLLAKAARVINAARPPARISEDPTWFECRFCDHHAVCHGGRTATHTCRSCLHSTPVEGGWHCARHDRMLSPADERFPCLQHLFIPDLVPGEVIDAGRDFVAYRMADGTTWVDEAHVDEDSPMLTLRPYQQSAIDAIYGYFAENAGHPLVVMPTGCHARGTQVLMFDGSTRAVEDIMVGDLLMGPDSQPRRVLRLIRGHEPLYRISPKKGEPFVVNQNHVLSLQTTNEGKSDACTVTGTEIENVPLSEWLSRSKSWKHLRKLRRTAVDFPDLGEPPLDPWALGVLLGDGCVTSGITICNPDFEVLREFDDKMTALGLVLRWSQKPGNKAYDAFFIDPDATRSRPNRIMAVLRDLGVAGCTAGDKFVPGDYKLGSRRVRLEVLAGLIDTDGHYDGKVFDFVTKSRRLAEDVVFISRSLGLWAKVSECQKFCQTGAGGTYWRVPISGDIDVVPTRVPRKQAAPRRQKKNPLVTGFDVEPIGDGEFFGFTLDGDHLYLTADFVVHHNSGKSIVIAAFVQGVLRAWPDQRILIVTHVRELIAQNHAELIGLWRDAPAGIYSAGLGRRDLGARILFAGIQSIHRRAYDVQQCDLVLIDEAHLIPGSSDTTYRRFLDTLSRINPQLKVIGFTATPYRLDSGMLHEGKGALFTDIAYEVSVRQLIDDGFLCPLVSKAAETRLDVTGVGSRGGEFIPGQLQAAVDLPEITEAAIDEVVRLGGDRRSWLAFCAGVEHATHVAEAIRARGFSAATIFGDAPKTERDRIIAAFKRGEIRALASMGVLTTGFNAPGVDLIAMLRPTKSAGLYVQMAGRGTRLAPGKENCLVLDFAGNVARHGPIDAVKPKRPGSGEGDAPVKVCPDCQSILATAVRLCPDCGHAFPPPKVQVEREASTLAILTTGKPQWLRVDGVFYRAHEKPGSRPTLQVEYQCGLVRHREWICFEHTGYARQKAVAWWRQRAPGMPVPHTVTEALAWSRQIAAPTEIAVRPSGRFTEIASVRFAPCPSAPSAAARPAATAGSTPASRSPTRVETTPAAGSAAGPARTSAIGDAA